jgi:hypothetical protein
VAAQRSHRRAPSPSELARRQLQSADEYVYRFHDPVVAAVAMLALQTKAIMQARPRRARDHSAVYRRRLELHPGKSARQATSHGTGSRRVTPTTARNRPYAQIAARNRALDAVSKMRRSSGMSLTKAAHDVGTTPDAVRRYAGQCPGASEGSRWVAKPRRQASSAGSSQRSSAQRMASPPRRSSRRAPLARRARSGGTTADIFDLHARRRTSPKAVKREARSRA